MITADGELSVDFSKMFESWSWLFVSYSSSDLDIPSIAYESAKQLLAISSDDYDKEMLEFATAAMHLTLEQ